MERRFLRSHTHETVTHSHPDPGHLRLIDNTGRRQSQHLCQRQGRKLSGGEQKRVALARALVLRPKYYCWMNRRPTWIRPALRCWNG
ncbi:MAG: ATP-binding cassette domain-containing protein [Desulfuromonas sp.]|nr:ATP-binding cassette domain-containing protein [Desulfuromonas sp.]